MKSILHNRKFLSFLLFTVATFALLVPAGLLTGQEGGEPQELIRKENQFVPVSSFQEQDEEDRDDIRREEDE